MSLPRFAALCSLLVLVFLLAVVTDAHCQDNPSPAFKVTAGVMAGLGAADVIQTTSCVRAGTCRETNPIFKSQASSALVLGAAKAATVTATWAIASRLHRKGHRKTAWGVLIGVTAVQASAVAWNARQLAKVK